MKHMKKQQVCEQSADRVVCISWYNKSNYV